MIYPCPDAVENDVVAASTEPSPCVNVQCAVTWDKSVNEAKFPLPPRMSVADAGTALDPEDASHVTTPAGGLTITSAVPSAEIV